MCPRRVLLQPSTGNWTAEKWESLTYFQQALWFVDEGEAGWQRLLQDYPEVPYIECNWHEDLQPCFQAVADVLGVEVKDGGKMTCSIMAKTEACKRGHQAHQLPLWRSWKWR